MNAGYSLTRRVFLNCLSSGGLCAAYGLKNAPGLTINDTQASSVRHLVDTHVYLFPFPFRRVPHDEPEQLVACLKRHGVSAAWAGSFDALLHKDIASANARLWETCRRVGDDLLVPCGTVNPTIPNWQKELQRCVQDYQMPMIRVFPGYHGYSLDAPEVGRLLGSAAEAGLAVQIVVEMEDIRGQNPLLAVKPVDVNPLLHWLHDIPALRVMLLNCHRSVPVQKLRQLMASGNVYVDLGMLEGMVALERVTAMIPVERICFGSYSPVFYFESALLKILESRLGDSDREAICYGNAKDFFVAAAQRED